MELHPKLSLVFPIVNNTWESRLTDRGSGIGVVAEKWKPLGMKTFPRSWRVDGIHKSPIHLPNYRADREILREGIKRSREE